MSIQITQRPQRYLDPGELFLSKWNCSGSEEMHMMYYLQRRDVEVISVTPGASDIDIEVGDNAVTVAIAIGDVIYLSALSYDTTGVVTATSGGGGSNVILTVAIDPVLNPTSGYINLLSARPNYYLEVTLQGWNSTPGFNHVSGAFEPFATVRLFPDARGLIKFDARPFINKYVTHNLLLVDQRNTLDKSQGSFFYLDHAENWTGSTETLVTDGGVNPNLCYFVPAAKQLGDEYGNNLAEFVPFDDTLADPKAKFLTAFTKPTYFIGFPFRLYFIYSELLAGYEVTMEQDYYNNNAASPTGNADELLITSQAIGVNQLMLIDDITTPLSASATHLDVWLEVTNEDSNDYYVNDGYYDSGYTESIVAPGAVTPFRFTEKKRIKINRKGCGVQLWWKGPFGNWEQWVFDVKYTRNTSSGSEGVRGVYNEDVEDATRVIETIKAKKTKSVTLFTRILQEDLTGLESIEESVQILLYDPTTTKFLSLQHKPRSIKSTTEQSSIAIELTLELPERNTVGR